MTRFTSSDGRSLAYRDEGEGLPVLCLAGLTRNMSDFDDLAAALAGRAVRLIRMDYRGRGASDHDSDWRNYAVPVEARDATELLDHLGIDRTAIIGTSRGGLIAMFLAATAKDRLSGVLLNDVGPKLEASGLEAIMGYLGKPPKARSFEEQAKALAAMYADSFPGVPLSRWARFAKDNYNETDAGLALTYDPSLRNSVEAAMKAGAFQADVWPLFDALAGLPVALIRGENSDLLSQATSDKMAARHAGLIRADVPDRGHVPFLDEPKAKAAIDTWLEALNP